MTTRYFVRKNSVEISIRDQRDLRKLMPGCSSDDCSPELIGTFDSEQAARKALDRCVSSVDFKTSYYGGYLANVTEYYLEAATVEIDEDGDVEYICGQWVDYTAFPAEIDFCGDAYAYNLNDGWVVVEEDDND